MEMTGEYLFAQSPLTADTIAAVATPPGTGGIAVIRLSGPDAITVFKKVWKGASPDSFKSHTAHLGEIIDTSDRTIIDQVVATYFQAPGSFTGENTIEISCHGSHYIQSAVMNALLNAGARTAGPGEFTQRAFLNGRIDLAQAEAIADLIAARARAAKQAIFARFSSNVPSQARCARPNRIMPSRLSGSAAPRGRCACVELILSQAHAIINTTSKQRGRGL